MEASQQPPERKLTNISAQIAVSKEPKPKHHGFEFGLVAVTLAIEFGAIFFGAYWLSVGAAVFLWLAIYSYCKGWASANLTMVKRAGFHLGSALMSAVLLVGIPYGYKYFTRQSQPRVVINPPPPGPPTPIATISLLDLFKSDFPNTMGISDDGFDLTGKGEKIHVIPRIYLDFPEKTEFIGFYIASSEDLPEICLALRDKVQPILDGLKKRHDISGGEIGNMTDIKDLIFTGRVYIYHGWPLSNKEKADIVESYSARKMDVEFRGVEYLATRSH